MISNSKVPWDVHPIAASHSPFLSQPSVVAGWISYEVVNFQSVASNSSNILDSTITANMTSPLGLYDSIISPADSNMTLAEVS